MNVITKMREIESSEKDTKEEYEQKVKDYVDNLDNQISDVESKFQELSEEGKQEAKEKLQLLKEKRRTVGEKFTNLQQSTEDNWGSVKSEINELTTEVKARYEGILSGLEYAAEKAQK